MRLIDTHAHLDEEAFAKDIDAVLERAVAAGVELILTIGTTAESSEAAVKLAEQHTLLKAAVGIQPNYVAECREGDWDRIVQLSRHPEVIAVGETGLDRYWDFAPLDLQRDYFQRHLELSRSTQLPFIVHCREAESDVLEVLTEAADRAPLHGVMHSFCGDQTACDAFLQLGLYISFAGMVTFKRNDDLRSVAASVPDDRLLMETDSPYLAPIPNRGKRNEPAFVAHTAECVAVARGVECESLALQTTLNALRFLRLDGER